MTTFDPKKNFAVSTVLVAPTPALTGTTLQVAIGEGALFPLTAAQAFNAVVWPANAPPTAANAEIVRVVRAGDAFTITRAQEGSAARAIQVGDRIMQGITVKALTDIEAAINAAAGSTVLSGTPILEPGVVGQVSRGRVLTLPDFTTLLGLTAPVAGYNLTDLTDFSGNGRSLTNKGAVAFGSGILGAVAEAAVFAGSTAQALYIVDAGAGDPFRIPYGSVGCWVRVAKTGVLQQVISKAAGAAFAYQFYISSGGAVGFSPTTVAGGAGQYSGVGVTNVCDDRWHFAVATYDGSVVSIYVDGALENSGAPTTVGPMIGAASPFNIGGQAADGATLASNPFFGRVDEAFVTQDVLSLDQVRTLYAAKVAHGFGAVPLAAKMSVRRLRKGATLGPAIFSTPPLHLYNFSGGTLTDAGSLAVALANNNVALVAPAPDGAQGNAFNFVAASSQSLSASDAGLPAGTSARTLGCWFKTSAGVTTILVSYGTTLNTNDVYFGLDSNGKLLGAMGGSSTGVSAFTLNDGQWHFAVLVIDPAASDGLLMKMYCDGRIVGSSSAALVATVLGGANKFRIGSSVAASLFLTGSQDAVFVTGYALSADEIAKLYAQGSLSLGVSPKNAGDHVEAMDATSVYLIADTLESQNLIDLEVAA